MFGDLAGECESEVHQLKQLVVKMDYCCIKITYLDTPQKLHQEMRLLLVDRSPLLVQGLLVDRRLLVMDQSPLLVQGRRQGLLLIRLGRPPLHRHLPGQLQAQHLLGQLQAQHLLGQLHVAVEGAEGVIIEAVFK